MSVTIDTEHAIDLPSFKREMVKGILAHAKDRGLPDYVQLMSGCGGRVYEPDKRYIIRWTQKFQRSLGRGGLDVHVRLLGLGMDTGPLGAAFPCAFLALRADTLCGIRTFSNFDLKDPEVYGIGVYALYKAP